MDELDITQQIKNNIAARDLQTPAANERREYGVRADDTGTGTLIGYGFSAKSGLSGAIQFLERKGITPDPDFNIDDHPELRDGLALEDQDGLLYTRSYAEAMQYRNDALSEMNKARILANAGGRGVVAMALGGLLDVDLPLMFVSGGSYAGGKVAAGAAKIGLQGTRIARAAQYGAAGAEAGILTESVNAMVRPTGDWTDVPAAGLSGLAFGSVIGASAGKHIDAGNAVIKDVMHDETGAFNMDSFFGLFKKKEKEPEDVANEQFGETRREFSDNLNSGSTEYTDFTAKPGTPDDIFTIPEYKPGEFASQGTQDMIMKSEKFVKDTGIDKRLSDAFGKDGISKAGGKFQKVVDKTPFSSDWGDLMTSDSYIAKTFAYKAFESPAGIVRNNRSAAMWSEMYQGQIASPVTVPYNTQLKKWIAETNRKDHPVLGMHRQSAIDAFNREFLLEMQSRYHDGVSVTSSKAVKEFADGTDIGSARALQILQDKSSPVRGSENLQPKSGWFPQRWRGDNVIKVIRDIDAAQGGKKGRGIIEDTLAKSYMKLHGWSYEEALQFAKAVTRRALAKERGIDTNLARLLDEEGTEYLIRYLKDNGIADNTAQKMVDGLKGSKLNEKKESFLKHRTDIDLREQIPGTNFRLVDLVDTDVVGVWTTYSRRASGAAALSRQGIQRSDKKSIIDAILEEQSGRGSNKLSREQLEGMFSYFEGGAYAGGINNWARRAMGATRLALLNMLGIPQLAETGPIIAAVGLKTFMKASSKEIRELMTGRNSTLSNELRSYTAFIDGEHKLFQDHLMLDDTRPDAGMYAELGSWLDKLLSKGSYIQGYTSGFFKIRQLQQRTAVRSMIYRLSDMFTKNKALSTERLYDLGFDDNMVKRISKYFTDGTVQLSKGGDEVLSLNWDKWNPDDIYDFTLALNRHAHQVVQKAMKGESTFWMNKTEGALLMQLKSFPMLAMQKQLARNMKIQDIESRMVWLYSAMTAAAAYGIRAGLTGKEENLEPIAIMKGAFNLSNMTGWLPMWSDPVATMFGMDDLRFNHYGSLGAGGSVVGVPPVFQTLDRMARIPSSAVKVALGDYKNKDIYALQATPIIGNAVGFGYMFNEMKK